MKLVKIFTKTTSRYAPRYFNKATLSANTMPFATNEISKGHRNSKHAKRRNEIKKKKF